MSAAGPSATPAPSTTPATTVTTPSWPVISCRTIEDYIPLIALLIGAADNTQLSTLVPGVPGYILGVFVGGLSKALVGIAQSIRSGQNPTAEDLLQAVLTLLGVVGTTFSANPQYIFYGTAAGWLGKSLGMFSSGFNVEDLLLALSSILTLAGTYFGTTSAVTLGSFLIVISKSVPSIGTDGAAGMPNATPAPVAA